MMPPSPELLNLVDAQIRQLPPLQAESHGLLILGAGSGVLIDRILQLYGPKPDDEICDKQPILFRQVEAEPQRRIPILVYEPDESAVARLKDRYVWSRALNLQQLRFYWGDEGLRQLEAAIDSPLSQPITNCLISPDAQLDSAVKQRVLQRIQTLLQARMKRVPRLVEEWKQRHPVPAMTYRERYATGKKLKILLCHTRYAIFTGQCLQSLARGFEKLGHETLVLIERDDTERVGPDAVQSAVNAYQPDLMVTINYPRHFFESGGCCLAGIPLCCWIQDPPWNNQYQHEAIRSRRQELDFYFSCMQEWATDLTRLGYGEVPILKVPTDPDVFYPAEPSPDEWEQLHCEVSFVSRISERAIRETFAAEDREDRLTILKLYPEVYRQLEERLEHGEPPFTPDEYKQMIIRQSPNRTLDPVALNDAALLLEAEPGRLAIRGLPIVWLIEDGRDVHCYGWGWNDHPRLGNLQRGKVPYGPLLAALLRCSKIHLCNHGIWTLTMKVLDCFAAGTFPLVYWVDPARDTGPITDWFVEDRDVVLFRTRDELLDKTRFYLRHETERQTIAMRGREIVLNHFTYTHAARTMLESVQARLAV